MSPRFLQCFAPLERSLLHILLPILPQELQVQPLLVGIKVLVRLVRHKFVLPLNKKTDITEDVLSAHVVDIVFDCHDSANHTSMLALAASSVLANSVAKLHHFPVFPTHFSKKL